jgi:deoxyribonuclease V
VNSETPFSPGLRSLERLSQVQVEMAPLVCIPPAPQSYSPHDGDIVFGLDTHYVDDTAHVALHAQEWSGRALGTYTAVTRAPAPYVPQYFCFREGPVLLRLIDAVDSWRGVHANLLIVDGHGIAHPRRFGLPCWLGVQTGLPTIGCAKRTLIPYDGALQRKRGHFLAVKDGTDTVGAVLVTRNGVKPVFVSPGHKVDVATASEVVLSLAQRSRLPEPLRWAHVHSRACAQGCTAQGVAFSSACRVWGSQESSDQRDPRQQLHEHVTTMHLRKGA